MATDAQVSTGKALGIDVSAELDSIAAAIIWDAVSIAVAFSSTHRTRCGKDSVHCR
jgi:hypothetical protein